MKTTRAVSSAQEKRIEKAIGGKRTPNSGATKFDKGDIIVKDWLVEAKTCMEPKKSFTIKQEWLTKMKQEQYATGKMYSSLCFDFGDSKDRYYIVDENTFRYMIELLDE
jgi:hypothetical protein